jgi:hypothetical protein
MDCGRAGTEIRAVVLAGEGIHRVLAEETFLRRLHHGIARGFLESDLVKTGRAIHVENHAAGVLADGLGFIFRELDVLLDDLHRGLGDGALLLGFERGERGAVDVVRDFSGGATDQLQKRFLQQLHRDSG